MAILIPVWQPDRQLTDLAQLLLDSGFGALIIVDDGSDSAHESTFKTLHAELAHDGRVHILRHQVNLGKGRALKTGLDYFRRSFPNYLGVITADADGQHRPADILRIAEQLGTDPSCVVIGSRRFEENVPARSRFGNFLAREAFIVLTGTTLADTQCGLRGIPAGLVSTVLNIDGDRYEYEMNVLGRMAASSCVSEVAIETVYMDGNKSSHFRPFVDSMRIAFVLLRFFASSIIAALIDLAVFGAVFAATSSLLLSMVAGRVSSLANFALNRRFVFHSSGKVSRALLRYYLLAAGLGASAYFLIRLMVQTSGANALAAKILVETALWFASFVIQRFLVFGSRRWRNS